MLKGAEIFSMAAAWQVFSGDWTMAADDC